MNKSLKHMTEFAAKLTGKLHYTGTVKQIVVLKSELSDNWLLHIIWK